MSEALPAVTTLRRSVATPQNIALRQVMADGIIAVAAKAKDWPLLHEAVDIKIEDQREYLTDWDRRVRGVGNPNLPILTDHVRIGAAVLEAESGISQKQVSRWRKSLEDTEKYHAKMVLAACRAAGIEPPENHRAEGTGENEWFTPEIYIAAARAAMGAIDLDPATHPIAQQTVRAAEFFTVEDGSLEREWHGRVWLNPPYAQPLIGQFVSKLVEEVEAQRVTQAILLTHNYTDTTWFRNARGAAEMLCFTTGRIKFIDIDGDVCAPTQGQAFFYYGGRRKNFEQEFERFGWFAWCHA